MGALLRGRIVPPRLVAEMRPPHRRHGREYGIGSDAIAALDAYLDELICRR